MSTAHPAQLLTLQSTCSGLRMLLASQGEQVRLDIAVPPAAVRVLRRLVALQGYAAAEGWTAPLTRLLARALGTEDAAAVLLIRIGPSPGFWLLPDGEPGPWEIDVDVVDAFCLLTSGRFPLRLERGDQPGDWDAALDELWPIHEPKPAQLPERFIRRVPPLVAVRPRRGP